MPKKLHAGWLYQMLAIFSCSLAMTFDKAYGESLYASPSNLAMQMQDSIAQDSSALDSAKIDTVYEVKLPLPLKKIGRSAQILDATVDDLARFPAVSLQQYLKGQVAGLYVQESNGEPGSVQSMLIRGASIPLLSARELYQNQPLVILDGIQLIGEHPFAYDIQQYDFNRIGTATNLLTNIDMANIASVEVLKDLTATAIYGPRGANGVILLKTKQAENRRAISFNAYTGMVQRPTVTTLNGDYENSFRQQFYDRYTPAGRYTEDDVYPLYLSDSLNADYYGPSNWTDSYYRNALVYSIDASIAGGTDRANFRFALGNLKNKGVADDTGLDRYSASFTLNMKPIKWMTFSAMFNGNRLDRQRNRNLRDRFALMNYIPDLSAPLAPNKDSYDLYLKKYENSFDDNNSNIVEGFAGLLFDLGRLTFSTKFSVDYNEGYRDLFYPRTLLENNSFASNYYGYSQRIQFENLLTYKVPLSGSHNLSLEAGQFVQWDTYKYNYAYAYRGVNDFIKLNLLESDPNNSNYLTPLAFPRELVYKFLDRTKHNLLAFYGRANYSFDQKYKVSLLLRGDASSNAQPTNRWLFTPVLAAEWNIKEDLMTQQDFFDVFNLRVGAGRTGRINAFDNFAQGPQYTAEIGFTGNVTTPGYNGFAVLTRPYSSGWIGYDLPWAYSDQLNLGLDLGFLQNRIKLQLDGYMRQDKNMMLAIPAYAEYGYRYAQQSGMEVHNTGLDISIQAAIIPTDRPFSWTTRLNVNLNKNKLNALPGGLDEIVLGNRKLEVGKPVDQYWLFQNEGIYLADDEVPLVNGQPMKFNGTALKAGDPKWVDTNNDQVISSEDKILAGNMLPRVTGGFTNQFFYQKWSLTADLYFNLGRKILNQEMANRFDFINREGTNTMDAVKEITFWEKRGEYGKYPLYNPWSTVIPYRVEQDLFLENGAFLKMRTLSLSYDMSEWLNRRTAVIKKLRVYVSGHNLFTITPYTGQDPELVNYTGYDTGYGLPIPRTYTLGVQVDL